MARVGVFICWCGENIARTVDVQKVADEVAKIPGVRFQPMPGMGHFPFAENPGLFAEYLLPILNELTAA